MIDAIVADIGGMWDVAPNEKASILQACRMLFHCVLERNTDTTPLWKRGVGSMVRNKNNLSILLTIAVARFPMLGMVGEVTAGIGGADGGTLYITGIFPSESH